jgi:hypothetical protein
VVGEYKEDEKTGHITCMGRLRNAFKILVRVSGGTRPVRRPRYRWWGGLLEKQDVNCIHLIQDKAQW